MLPSHRAVRPNRQPRGDVAQFDRGFTRHVARDLRQGIDGLCAREKTWHRHVEVERLSHGRWKTHRPGRRKIRERLATRRGSVLCCRRGGGEESWSGKTTGRGGPWRGRLRCLAAGY